MRTLCRSFWLVGICLARVALGAPEAKSYLHQSRVAQEPGWHTAELPGGLRLALAKSDQAEHVRLCTGFAVLPLGRDDVDATNALVDLQMRMDALADEPRQTGGPVSTWRQFGRIRGDAATFCLSVPNADFRNALSVILDVSKPLVANRSDCDRALEQWQAHRGLAKVAARDSYAARLQALAWFGSSQVPPENLGSIRQRLAATDCEQWRTLAAWGPSPAVLTIIGDFDPESLESEIRSRPIARPRPRAASFRPAVARKLPVRTYPRFVRMRSNEPGASAVYLGWPVIHQGQQHAIGLRLIASVIEQRLNRTLLAQERRAATRVNWAYGYGTFEVEVRPTRLDELSSTEERVLAVIDQLRTGHVSSAELATAVTHANTETPAGDDSELDRALQMAETSLISWDARTMNQLADPSPTPAELRELTERFLSRNNIAEVFVEGAAPRQRAVARNEDQRPKGLTHVVRAGESLQMIARKFRVTIPELIRANHLRHPDQIAPGTRLVIPSATRVPSSK